MGLLLAGDKGCERRCRMGWLGRLKGLWLGCSVVRRGRLPRLLSRLARRK